MPVFAPVTTAILSLKSVAHPILILPIICLQFGCDVVVLLE